MSSRDFRQKLAGVPNLAPSGDTHWLRVWVSQVPPLQLICVLYPLLPFSQWKLTEWSPCLCLGLGHVSKLVCPVPCAAELVLQAHSSLVRFMELWGLSVAHPLGLLLQVRTMWVGTGLFPLAPVQVSIVQTGGFILCTHLDLSLLGALLWKRK